MPSAPLHIDLDPGPEEADERIQAWRAALAFSHDVAVRPADRAGFTARLDGYHLGPVLLADIRAGRCTAIRDRALVARHALDQIAVDVMVEGSFTGTLGPRRTAVGPGDCVILDLKQTMRIDLTAHRCLSLVIPRAVLRSRPCPARAPGGHVFAAGSAEARLIGGFLRQIVGLAPDLPEGLAAAAGLAGVDLLQACLAAGAGAAPRPGAAGAEEGARRDVARIERFIERHVARQDLGPDLLCAQFGLSRASLYRLMAPRGGVADLVRRHRVAHAHLLLTTAQGRGLAVADIARRSGFKSPRTLRRGLREAYAASARDLRAAGPREDDQAPPARPSASAWIDAE